ncbi:MAG: DUF5710 domain-containing protein [Thaumarchaeota archaeon]|nr:DUF5710 domain-containing protein [Nitrososphaerota archaeon]
MRIVWNRDRFEFQDAPGKRDTYDNKEEIKAVGGRWDPEKKVWYCLPEIQRLAGLRPLSPSISPEAKAKFDEFEAIRLATISASRAVDSAFDVPCPSGLAFLPYQKAGVAFALRIFGDLK